MMRCGGGIKNTGKKEENTLYNDLLYRLLRRLDHRPRSLCCRFCTSESVGEDVTGVERLAGPERSSRLKLERAGRSDVRLVARPSRLVRAAGADATTGKGGGRLEEESGHRREDEVGERVGAVERWLLRRLEGRREGRSGGE
jgi:hypothetical protein